MEFVLRDYLSAIARRKSTRRFKNIAVSDSAREALLATRSLRLLDIAKCRVEYVEGLVPLDDIFTGIIGSYGKIVGSRAALCLIIPTQAQQAGKMEAGFLGEQYVLRATALGLGSCWVGGTFNYKKLMMHLSIGPDEAVAAIIALGWPEENKDTVGKILHAVVRRKDLASIAGKSLLLGPDWLTAALRAVRSAPSAVNLQPWFFSGSPERIELKSSRNGAFTPMDLGIAMCHFELAAEAHGCQGRWLVEKDGPFFVVSQGEA